MITQIVSDDKFEILVDISELNIGNIYKDQPVVGNVTAIGLETPLVIRTISPVDKLIQNIIAYEVVLDFVEQHEGIKTGLSIDVEFITESYGEIIAVPENALIEKGDRTFVLVKEGKKYKEREVSRGITTTSGLVAIDGVEDGEVIVVSK